jgi:hypothetical protein
VAAAQRRALMPPYIDLLRWTEHGVKSAKETVGFE